MQKGVLMNRFTMQPPWMLLVFVSVPFFCSIAYGESRDSVFTTCNTEQREAIQKICRQIHERPQSQDDLGQYIQALGNMDLATHGGRAMRRTDIATMQIVAMGVSALPSLIDATEHGKTSVRTEVLEVIYTLAERHNLSADVIPVFARSLRDRESTVRAVAAKMLGRSCSRFGQTGDSLAMRESCTQLDPALRDGDENVRLTAALYLTRIGRTNMIPEKVRNEISAKGYSSDWIN